MRINNPTAFKGSAILLLTLLLLGACDSGSPKQGAPLPETLPSSESQKEIRNDLPELIRQSIEVYGGNNFLNYSFAFHFRDKWYSLTENEGLYKYTRNFTNIEGQQVEDVLTNDGFERHVNQERAELTDERRAAYTASVNSVAYFLLLPYRLADPAARFEDRGLDTIQGEVYQRYRVTFGEEQGGEDHQDVFLFWFNPNSKTMNYFAYRYYSDGGGVRFRSVLKTHNLANGIVIQDYINYKWPNMETPLESLGSKYEEGELIEVSRIENHSIRLLN